MKELTQEKLKSIIHYNPLTGLFVWKIASGRVKVGGIAGSIDKKSGYWQIGYNGKRYTGHRLAFLYVHGYFPEKGIDHKNRNKLDNTIDNLRHVSQMCNCRNSKVAKRNTSGVTGVTLDKRTGRWLSLIRVNYKRIYLGIYDSFSDAVRARWEGEKEHDFPNCNTSSSAFLWLRRNNI